MINKPRCQVGKVDSKTPLAYFNHQFGITSKEIKTIIDTGSAISLIKYESLSLEARKNLNESNKTVIRGITGDEINTIGEIETKLFSNPITFHVLKGDDITIAGEALIGLPILMNSKMDFSNKTILFDQNNYITFSYDNNENKDFRILFTKQEQNYRENSKNVQRLNEKFAYITAIEKNIYATGILIHESIAFAQAAESVQVDYCTERYSRELVPTQGSVIVLLEFDRCFENIVCDESKELLEDEAHSNCESDLTSKLCEPILVLPLNVLYAKSHKNTTIKTFPIFENGLVIETIHPKFSVSIKSSRYIDQLLLFLNFSNLTVNLITTLALVFKKYMGCYPCPREPPRVGIG